VARRRAGRRGGVALIVAGLLTLTVIALAFVIDLAYAWVVRAQLQNAADAAAHAAVAELDGTTTGLAEARAAAVSWAAENRAAGHDVALDPTHDVALGYWEDGRGFVESSDALYVDTVRVEAHGEAPGFFAPIAFGVDSFDATARTTVQGGGVGDVGCYLPLAVPSCLVAASPGGICDVTLTFKPMSDKNVAWARVDGSARPNAAWIRDQLNECTDAGASVGEVMQLDNGTVNSALMEVRDRIEDSSRQWAPRWGSVPGQLSGSAVAGDKYGRVISGPVPVFESESCAGGPYVGGASVIGFAQIVVYDVQLAPEATISARILCDEEVGAVPGGIAGTGYSVAPRFRQ
jgi:hypothetical protein